MKKLAILFCVSTSLCFGQTIDTTQFHIIQFTDQMTDKNYFMPSIGLVCIKNNEVGFRITPDFDNRRGPVAYNGISVLSAGIGGCVEDCTLIFLFEDGSKVQMESWNKFNCDGNSWFDYNKTLLSKIAKPIKAIRFTNGRTFDSYTHQVPEEDKHYFVNVKSAIENQLVVNKGYIE